MRLAPAVAAALLAGACDVSPPSGEPSGPLRTDNRTANASDNTVAETGTADPPPGDLPAPGPVPRFVGNWAADLGSCESAAWQFTDSTLRTPAGASCSFNRVTEAPKGYDIQATCTAEGPPISETLTIRFAEPAKAMLFESEAIADSTLAFCGREE